MLQQRVIRKVLAGFMLLLFAFSIVPRKLLHDHFSNHKEVYFKYTGKESIESRNSGVGCKCEDLFATPDYQSDELSFELNTPVVYKSVSVKPVKRFYSSLNIFFSLRGPPAAV